MIKKYASCFVLFLAFTVTPLALGLSERKVVADCAQALSNGPQDNAFHKWLWWEQQANFPVYRKNVTALNIESVRVPLAQVDVWRARHLDRAIEEAFVKKLEVVWPRHPHNQNRAVPFSNVTDVGPAFAAEMTASRSVSLNEFPKYSLKLPTDHANGAEGEAEPEKLATKEDIVAAQLRGALFDFVDEKVPASQHFEILRDALTVADKKTGNGYLVRDLSALHDGHFYLPAFAIPFVGQEIAAINGRPFAEFWEQAYGEALGRAKAALLTRYALQFETPNAQNILIQFDASMKPTGKIYFRDLSDTELVGPLAARLGLAKFLTADKNVGFDIGSRLKPFWQISKYHFGEGANAIPFGVLESWGSAHDEVYAQEIERALSIKRSDRNSFAESLKKKLLGYGSDPITAIEEALSIP